MKRFLFLCSVAAAAFSAETVKTPIENDQVKVLHVTVQPHEKTRLHQHKVNRVMIYLDAGKQDFDYEGKKSTLEFKAGEVKWSPAGGMHIAEVTSDKPVEIVEIELKKPGDPSKSATGPMDPAKIDKKEYKIEFENDQVRVMRVKIGGRQTTPMHEHKLNRVVVYIKDQNFKVTNADGKVETPQHKAGDASWGEPAKHKEENLNDQPFEVVVVELKS